MKKQLEIGDKLQRFETGLTREIATIYEIISVTKTVAKDKNGKIFKRDLIFETTRPNDKFLAEVNLKGKISWSTPRYFVFKKKDYEAD